VWALDPDKGGEVMWESRVGQGSTNDGVQWGMASDGEPVYAAVDVVATRTATGRILDPKSGGGLTALRIADGNEAWYAAPSPCGVRTPRSPAPSAALTAIRGVVFSGSLDGHCAYAARDGSILWDFDTVRDYQT
jgi:polyvinyl alcohol dehydrogenase (cytochrome)